MLIFKAHIHNLNNWYFTTFQISFPLYFKLYFCGLCLKSFIRPGIFKVDGLFLFGLLPSYNLPSDLEPLLKWLGNNPY